MSEEASFNMFFEKDDAKLPKKKKFWFDMRKYKVLQNLYLKLSNTNANLK